MTQLENGYYYIENGIIFRENGYTNEMEIVGIAVTTDSVVGTEIRAKAEHTYENCHNITCRRKCQREGYNLAIVKFAEKLKYHIAKEVEDAESSDDLCCEIFQSEIDEIAEQMKGELL